MRRIVALLVVAGAFACAGTPVLPSVGAGSEPGARREASSLLPAEPKPQWRVAPSGQGAAVELRF